MGLMLVVSIGLVVGIVLGGRWFRDPYRGWQIFRSVKFGYVIKMPSGWVMDDSQKEQPADIAKSSDGKTFVAIQFLVEPRLLEEGGEEQVVADIKEGYRKDKAYVLSSFESRFENDGTPATVSGYLARGAMEDKGKFYVFQEYGVPLGDETWVNIKGAIHEDVIKEYQEMINKIMGSFDPVAGRREAFDTVKAEKEVKKYTKRLSAEGKEVTFGLEDGGDVWLVQVYEIIVERDGSSHTATFNWYRVNKETLKVTKEFENE